MPKAPQSPIRMYFLIQATECNGSMMSESECKACGLRMKGNHASNMERHVRRSHPGIYEKYLEIKQKSFNPISKNYEPVISQQIFEHFDPSEFLKKKFKSDNKVNEKPTNEDIKSILKENKREKDKRKPVGTTLRREEIIGACVELVTSNGRPFSLMNDSGFKTLLEPIVNSVSPSLTISESSVKKFVSEKAAKLRLHITESLKEKMINLKLDCITYCNRSFLSVNVQILLNNKIQIFTLGIIEIFVRNHMNNLSNIIFDELSQFGVSKYQIYSVTIDSASNLTKIFDNENNTSSHSISSSTSCKDEKFGNIIIPEDNGDMLMSVESLNSEVQVITVYNEFEDDDNDLDSNTTEIILSKLHLEVPQESKVIDDDFGFAEMKCISSILQLAINDAFKSCPELSETVKMTRNFLKKLNTSKNMNTFKKLNISLPGLDSLSRWRSTCDVIETLLSLKDMFIQLSLTSAESKLWLKLENWSTCMKSCVNVTDTLRTKQLTLCDVYKLWYNCILETSKINLLFAEVLATQMRNRQEQLFDNISFLSAVFLDPRFNRMVLNDDQKTKAVEHLLLLHQKMLLTGSLNHGQDNIKMETEEDELERIFKEQEFYNSTRSGGRNQYDNIEVALRNFCENEPRLKTAENIIDYWEKKKVVYPELYSLVNVILSVPATQISIASLADQIKYILANGKINIKSPLYKDVLLLRANANNTE